MTKTARRVLNAIVLLAAIHLMLYAFGVPPLWAQPLTEARERVLVLGHVGLLIAWCLSWFVKHAE